MPDDIDGAARELGFADRADLDRALRREWLFCMSAEPWPCARSPAPGPSKQTRPHD
jgi:hypothetical protein